MNEIPIVALFKAESIKRESDPYVEIIERNGLRTTIIPTLAFNFINRDLLQKHLQNSNDFQGIIFTSTRAVEAVHHVLTLEPGIVLSTWRKKENYSVGEATSKLSRILLELELTGEETGSSEQLCSLILSSRSKTGSKPFLFPCSNKRKEYVPKTLKANGINVIEVMSYETVNNPLLRDAWKKLISDEGPPDILVFFSPSGVQYSHEMVKSSYSNSCMPKCIAIGPSTEEALILVNIPPNNIANKPNPEAVWEAIAHILKNP